MKFNTIPLFILIFIWFFCQFAKAQDPQFTQIYASPMFLNPAFAGNHDYDCRKLTASRFKTMVAYRSQYNTDFNTLYGSIDYREKSGKLGIGAIIVRDKLGSAPLYNTQMGLIGSYKLPIINDWQIHFGLQANFNYRNVDFSQFTFPDQFSQSGLTSTTNEPLLNAVDKSYIDFAGGLLLFNEKFFGGFAAHHLNQPNQSMFDGATDKLPMKVGIHGGYKVLLKGSRGRGFGKRRGPERSLTPTVHYKIQGAFQQLEAGTFFNYDPLILGVWYRGIPLVVKTPSNAINHEALCIMAGTKVPTDYGLIRLGFSYDIPLASQINAFGRTFEITMSYQLINEKCRKRIVYKKIPCPGL
jgi:type IX secretion system PorP/SprF family membrane protein